MAKKFNEDGQVEATLFFIVLLLLVFEVADVIVKVQMYLTGN